MNKLFKASAAFLLCLLLLLSSGAAAFADAPLELDKTGSITVSPTDGQSIGTTLSLYCVAEPHIDNGDMLYALTADFAGSNADLSSLDDATALAVSLSAYAADKGLVGTTKAVDNKGSVCFDGLKPGLYLVIQELAQPGGAVVNPFLVSLPTLSDSGEWIYDVNANPKAEIFELIDITVKKVWNDGGASVSRPSSVIVTLYKDDAALYAVTLSSDNDWSYTWTGLAKSEGYCVKETQLDEYTASYSHSGYTFTVTNTPKLAQTGQLNWPIPLLAGIGIVLFTIGWALVFLGKRKSDEA